MGQFDGKTVFITGGARGQGRSHALAFAREGADVAFCDIAAQLESVPYAMSTPEDLAGTVEQVEALDRRCLGMVGDTRDGDRMREVVEEAITELGHVDFCLANAGIFTFSTIAEMSDRDWSEIIDTNLNISATMVFLCSEGARYITGETIAVAAGQNAGNAA
jgi:NAD(P)-dependent dehydrogenase (short-subunit alcohol dehydrogenase family)